MASAQVPAKLVLQIQPSSLIPKYLRLTVETRGPVEWAMIPALRWQFANPIYQHSHGRCIKFVGAALSLSTYPVLFCVDYSVHIR
jgi:hypothetical protein